MERKKNSKIVDAIAKLCDIMYSHQINGKSSEEGSKKMENIVKEACVKVFVKALDETLACDKEDAKEIIKNAKESVKEFLKTAGMEDQFKSIIDEAFYVW